MNPSCQEELKTRTILFVDDEPEVLSALRRSLRHEPYLVETAGGAGEALDWLNSHSADLVVADERMPEMTGTELLLEVQRRCPRAARVILTGYPNLTLMRQGLALGVVSTLHKPWDPEGLKRLIRSILFPEGEGEKTATLDPGPGHSGGDLGGEGG